MRTTILILLCLLLCTCQKSVVTQKQLSQDEYGVYSSISNYKLRRYNQYRVTRDTIQFIVVYHQTIKGSIISSNDSSANLLIYLSQQELYELASEFAKVSKDILEINEQNIQAPIKMIKEENINERELYGYTQGMDQYSRVGFNINRTKAIVYDRVWSEWGSELMYLLKNENGKWMVVDGLINVFGKNELLSSLHLERKSNIGVSTPIPEAINQYSDSSSKIN